MIIFFLVFVFKGAVLRPRRLGFGGVAVWIGCGRDGGLAMFLILLFFCWRGPAELSKISKKNVQNLIFRSEKGTDFAPRKRDPL